MSEQKTTQLSFRNQYQKISRKKLLKHIQMDSIPEQNELIYAGAKLGIL